MNILIALALASLYESNKCDFLNKNPKYLGGAGNLLKKKGVVEFLRPVYCKSCLWLGGADFEDTLKNGQFRLKKDVINKAKESVLWYSSFKSYVWPVPYLEGPNFFDGAFSCPSNRLCTIEFKWDGKNKFDQTEPVIVNCPTNYNNKNISEWSHEWVNHQFVITHHFSDVSNRKFISNQVSLQPEGFIDVKYLGIIDRRVDFDKTRILLWDKQINENGEPYKYIATILGYIDNYSSQGSTRN